MPSTGRHRDGGVAHPQTLNGDRRVWNQTCIDRIDRILSSEFT